MKKYKELIQKILIEKGNLDKDVVVDIVEESNEKFDSDYSVVCFQLAKKLSKSPQIIAEELKPLFINIPEIKSVDVVSGYINIKVNEDDLAKAVLNEFDLRGDKFGVEDIEEKNNSKKTIIVEYSSPNIAKEFHIGHLKTTLIGAYLYRLNKFLGYNAVGINHLGDYGTQFGKLIEGYNLWKDEYKLEGEEPIAELTKIYVRINELSKNDSNVADKSRENFKKLEEGDPETVKIWNMFVELSLKEFQKIYKRLNVSFDEIRGESAYSDDMDNVVKLIEDKGILKDSEGAKVVDLEDDGLGIALIKKSNDSSLYLTRDIATILYRMNKYDFDESLYVVASEQIRHFKQLFKIAELLDIDKKYLNGLKHIPYGMVRLPSGKMSTREGNVITVKDVLNEAVDRAYDIIKIKNNFDDEKEMLEVANKVGIGAIVFNNLSMTLIKDQIFDWNEVLNYSGDSGPYIQYNYVRIKNLFKEYELPKLGDIDINILIENESSYTLLKEMYKYLDVLKQSRDKDEPSILTNYLLNLTKEFSNYYTENKILVEDEKERNTKLYLSNMVASIIKNSCDIMGIELPKKM